MDSKHEKWLRPADLAALENGDSIKLGLALARERRRSMLLSVTVKKLKAKLRRIYA